MIIENVATTVLDVAKTHNSGRVAGNATKVAFDFTERWLRDSGIYNLPEHRQEQIGKTIGWSRDKVKNYSRTIESIGTRVLDFAKDHQNGRVPDNGTNVPSFDFTEGWFRDSGIYGQHWEYVP